jgi:peptidoglycan/xylan/chitin deacetylase (PgdA/CDA1 family)
MTAVSGPRRRVGKEIADFLREGEVVLTFDDGPWPGNTPAVLRGLAEQCTKAVFFPIGKACHVAPEILKQVAAAGHTIGSHTWSHADLSKLTYLSGRDIGIFSTDIDSFDFKIRKPEQVIASVVSKLKKHGNGIVLMHDFQHPTSLALPELLVELKTSGYRIVQVKAKEPVQTSAEYDQQLEKELGGGTANSRPTLSVVRTISE